MINSAQRTTTKVMTMVKFVDDFVRRLPNMTSTRRRVEVVGVLVMMMIGVAVGQLMSDVCKDVPDDKSKV